jgi:pyruvate/2-oxoglutarate dehydrogenase complex dihydrolipoamide acyltransferase (E2) component
MQGVYTASYQITSVTTSKTLMYVTAPSTGVVQILSAKVTETNVTTNEQLEFRLAKIATLGTPTATTLTPKPTESKSPAASSTVKGNVTASEPTYEQDGASIDLSIDRQGPTWPGIITTPSPRSWR